MHCDNCVNPVEDKLRTLRKGRWIALSDLCADMLIYADRGVLSAKELMMDTRDRSILAVAYLE